MSLIEIGTRHATRFHMSVERDLMHPEKACGPGDIAIGLLIGPYQALRR
jgi:hypothetical protein